MPEPDALNAVKPDPEPGLMQSALLNDLTRAREQLARSIARNNPELRSEQIATAINRILFPLLLLRIAKDRDLLLHGTPDDIRNFRTVPHLTGALAPYADALYPGDSPDSPWLPGPGQDLIIEDRVLRGVAEALFSPGGTYDCGKMQTGEISQVLMQYLTRTIRRSAAHQAVVVDTHETVVSGRTAAVPISLIGYMVKQALASARKNRSSREILPLRVFDPACGSGTVLIAACRDLLETAGGPSLTFDERKEILLHSVHGLDVSRHAVAATKMLLFLELCIGSGSRRDAGDFSGAALSVLQDLRHTVICGNALVGPEIVHDESWMFCPVRDRHTLNAFSYRDRFPEIVAAGGFDLIVSNPPEGALEQREWIQQYFQRRYSSYHPLVDRSAYFLEKSLALVSPGGIVSCVMGSRWLRGSGGSPLRGLLAARQMEEIVDLSPIPAGCPGAGLCLIRIRASKPARDFSALQAGAGFLEDPDTYAAAHRFPVDHHLLGEGGWALRDTRAESVLRKISLHGTPLAEFVMGQVHSGIPVPEDDPLVIDDALARDWLRRDPRCKALLRRLVTGDVIGHCHAGTATAGNYYLFIPRGWTAVHLKGTKKPWQWLKHRHPLPARHLQSHAEFLKARAGPDEEIWWETTCDEFWEEPRKKILFPARFSSPAFLYDSGRAVGDATTRAIPSAGLYLAGILNSRLIAFVFDHSVRQSAPGRLVFSWDDIGNLPVYTPDFDRPEDRARHDRMEKLVQRRIDLEKSCMGATGDPERGKLQEKIRAADRQIDALVCDLYGLTPEEITVIEEAVGG
jgi:hypothetical protein